MSPGLRAVLLFYSLLLLWAGLAFALRFPWAVDLWPYKYTDTISFVFIGSILVAGAASVLYCALARDPRAMVGVGVDGAVISGAVTITTLPVASHWFTAGGAAIALAAVALAVWFRRFPWRDTRKTPLPVRIAFSLFVAALLTTGGLLAAGSQRVLPWVVTPETARVYGWAFLGAATYFGYGLLVPLWSNAAGQLLAFLAYDLVLIGPFALYFAEVPRDRLTNHIAYVTVVVGSALIAILYCFVLPRTRLIRKRADPSLK
jgi:hypothetical protein